MSTQIKFWIKSHLHLLVMAFLVMALMARYIEYAADHGGIEHDSGWGIGVAKNLAELGKYATSTNTVASNEIGPGPSIHGRYQVQDAQGYVYFGLSGGLGPGYIVPAALLIKIFGHGYWALRAWSLLSFAILLVLIFSILLRLGGGLWSLLILAGWWWCFPHFSASFTFESYSEPLALMYLLISFLFFTSPQPSARSQILAGLFFSFAFLTKILFLLYGAAFFCFEVMSWLWTKKIALKRNLIFLGSFLVPVALFHLFRFIVLVSQFGMEAFRANNLDFILQSQQTTAPAFPLDVAFVLHKARLWADLGVAYPLCFWPLFLGALVYGFWRLGPLFQLMTLATLINFSWYILLNHQGFARYIWPGLAMGQLLFMLGMGGLIRSWVQRWRRFQPLWGAVAPALLVVATIALLLNYKILVYDLTIPFDQHYELTTRDIRSQDGRMHGFPSNMLQSLEDQVEIVNYFQSHLVEPDVVYFLGQFLVAEISPLVNRVFYPFTQEKYRYLSVGQRKKSYLILGPYQSERNPVRLVTPDYRAQVRRELCQFQDVLVENPSYMLCELRHNL